MKWKYNLTIFSNTLDICSSINCKEESVMYTRIPVGGIDITDGSTTIKNCIPVYFFCKEHAEKVVEMSKKDTFEWK